MATSGVRRFFLEHNTPVRRSPGWLLRRGEVWLCMLHMHWRPPLLLLHRLMLCCGLLCVLRYALVACGVPRSSGVAAEDTH